MRKYIFAILSTVLFMSLPGCFSVKHKLFRAASMGKSSYFEHEYNNESEAVFDLEGQSLLHTAVLNGEAEVVRVLLKKGFPVDLKNKNGQTALMLCTPLSKRYLECADLLMSKGADVNASIPANGRKAIFFAAANNNISLVEKLIESGADPLAKDSSGIDPLMVACHLGFYETAARLVSFCNNPNYTVVSGRSLLTFAVLGRNDKIIDLLLQKGAKVEICDKQGNSPWFYACVVHDLKMIKLLGNYSSIQDLPEPSQCRLYSATTLLDNSIEISDSQKIMIEFLLDNKVPFGDDALRDTLTNAKIYMVAGSYYAGKSDFTEAQKRFIKAERYYTQHKDYIDTEIKVVEKKIREANAAAVGSAILSGVSMAAGVAANVHAQTAVIRKSGYSYSSYYPYYNNRYTYYYPYYNNRYTYSYYNDPLSRSLLDLSSELTISSIDAANESVSLESIKVELKSRSKKISKLIDLCKSYADKANERIE